MKNLVKILRFIWQLPQNLLGLTILLILKIANNTVESSMYKDIHLVTVSGWNNGVSLGDIVILNSRRAYRDIYVVDHEYGHTRQSLYFGPLYLILIGIPSGLGNLWDRIFHKKWPYSKSTEWYYNQPWEKWADKLGNVKRVIY